MPALHRLPPLDSLRAFEAVSRHLSFTAAAAELHVTQSAVSQRIVALETFLGVRLFQRTTRRLTLTPEGEVLSPGVRRGLREIAEALTVMRRRGQALRVTTTPSFAARWLVPRLHRFRETQPAVAITVLAEGELTDLHAGGADIAIRFGAGRYPGLVSERLLSDAVIPVARPDLLARMGAPQSVEDLLRFHLLVDVSNETDADRAGWTHWFASLGIDPPREGGGQGFNQSALTIGAAASGLGVAMAQVTLVGDDLANGTLVQVYPHALTLPSSYFLVAARSALREPAVMAFRDWIVGEAALFSAAIGPLAQD